MVGIRKISNNKVKFAVKNMKANFIDCELSVKRAITFGEILYRKASEYLTRKFYSQFPEFYLTPIYFFLNLFSQT